MKKLSKRIAVLDFETDPFLFGRVPAPFVVELWDGQEKHVFWGDDCADQLADFLLTQTPLLIYAHNGGKFDFHFLHKYIENPTLIIKNRIVSAKLFNHQVRDSFAILPIPLRNYKKQDIDYSKMERENRDQHKDEILDYLHSDCTNLYELVSAFIDRFGPKMTIGSAAIGELEKFHEIPKNGSRHDVTFRKFYYGGRVQCFDSGNLKGPWKIYDVNSMYPSVMLNKRHPIGKRYDVSSSLPDTFDYPFFLDFTGTNHNALPSRADDGSLTFDKKHGRFLASSHEIEIALIHNLITIDEIHSCHVCEEFITFGKFVNTYFAEKDIAKKAGDIVNETFAKLILNSAYGRMGINPANFEEWFINKRGDKFSELEGKGYSQQCDYGDLELWSKPALIMERHYCDVAIAASITSAARAVLLEGLQNAKRPIYCDTDCIICEDFTGDKDKYRIGAWDLEKEADYCAIAGKKLYALYNRTDKRTIEKVKISSKGGTLSASEILAVAQDKEIDFDRAAPTFSLKSPPRFISRKFRKTIQSTKAAKSLDMA